MTRHYDDTEHVDPDLDALMEMERLPTLDEDEEKLERRWLEYPDFVQSDTFVVSGPLVAADGAVGHGRGTPMTLEKAQEWAMKKYGWCRVVPGAVLTGRWAFRVPKPKKIG